MVDVREMIKLISPDYLVVAETKLDDSFPSSQFTLDNYEIRDRRDRDKNGGGVIEYLRKGLICKNKPNLKCKNSEVICSELTVRNKKWIIFSLYRPPNSSNLHEFFNELEKSLDQAMKIYDNVIVMGDINIDLYDPNSGGLGKKKLVNITYVMIKLQFKLPQALISRGFTRRTVFHAPAFQQKGINQLMDIYQIWKPNL